MTYSYFFDVTIVKLKQELNFAISSAELDGVYKSAGGQLYHNRQSRVYQYKLTI